MKETNSETNSAMKNQATQTILCGFGINDGVREMTMEEYIKQIKSQFHATRVEAMRREENAERRQELKKKQFWIIPNGHIREGRRPYAIGSQPKAENIAYRDIQLLDLDNHTWDSPGNAWWALRQRLIEKGLGDYPLVPMESVSGKGLHIYVRLTEEMMQMSRREVIALWNHLLGVDFDPAVTDPARRAFQSHRLYCPDEEVALLFGAELTDKQREAMEQTPTNLPLYGEALHTSQGTIQANTLEALPIEGADAKASVALTESLDSQKRLACEPTEGLRGSVGAIAARLVTRLCGTTTPPEGMRNSTLFEAAKQLAYLDGTSEEDITRAFGELDWLGLPESEARGCIHRALAREKSWKYILPPTLTQAMADGHMDGDSLPEEGTASAASDNGAADTTLRQGHNFPTTALTFPHDHLPPLIAHIVSRVPENARASAAQALFAPLGSYVSHSCIMRDLTNLPRHMQFTEIVGGGTSSGKGYLPRLCEAIMARRIEHDRQAYQALDNWKSQCQQLAKGEQRPPKPCTPTYYLKTNITQAALIEKMKLLEEVGGRALMVAPEIVDLKYCQSATGGSAAHQLLLAAHDTPSQWGADRAGVESISASTTLSLNIAASATPHGLATFMKGGAENGTINRCSVSIVPSTHELPRYSDFDTEWHTTLDRWIDNIEQATGEIHCEEADLVIEDLRQWYNTTPEIANRPVLYAICHRQILIAKQRAYLLYIAEGNHWTDEMETFVRWSFHYQLESLYRLFTADILTYENTQSKPLGQSLAPVGGKRCELLDLPHRLGKEDLIALRQSRGAKHNLDALAKEQLRTWRRRGFIAPEEDGRYAKTELWYVKHPEDKPNTEE